MRRKNPEVSADSVIEIIRRIDAGRILDMRSCCGSDAERYWIYWGKHALHFVCDECVAVFETNVLLRCAGFIRLVDLKGGSHARIAKVR